MPFIAVGRPKHGQHLLTAWNRHPANRDILARKAFGCHSHWAGVPQEFFDRRLDQCWVLSQQIQLLTAIEKTPFFLTVREHTLTGMFASPKHGGNFNKAGWKLVGFEDTLNFKPPFGYYDAIALKAGK